MKQGARTDRSSVELVSHLMFRLLPLQVLLAALSEVNDIVTSLFASNAVGPDSMAAVGLYAPVSILVTAASLLIASGSQILASGYLGKGQSDRTQAVFVLGLVLAGAFGLVVTALLAIAALSGVTDLMADDQVVCDLFDQYLLGKAIGVLPFMIAVQLTLFLSMENQMKLTSIASVIYIAANAVLSFVLVLWLDLEAFGLGLASSAGSWVFALVLAGCFVAGKSAFRLDLKTLDWDELPPLFRLGLPDSITNGYFALRAFILNAMILAFVGSAGLSAYTTVYVFMALFWALPDGMLAVTRMLMGVAVGEEDRQMLIDMTRVMFRRYVPLVAAMCAVVCLCAEPLTNLYYHDPDSAVYQMTLWGFRIFAWCLPLSVITMHFRCYGNTIGRNFYVHAISVLDGLVCVLAFSALLMPFLQLNGVFLSYVLRGLAVFAFVLAYAWVHGKRWPRGIAGLLAMPAGFGVQPNERMDLTVHDVQEVVTVSQRVRAFCAERGIDARRTLLAGLCLEEMAGNVVEHGFAADGRNHSVDIRVVHKGDSLILRIKDDCKPFDPAQRHQMIDPEDKASNIGIRMVFDIASLVAYQHILGLNVLTMRL